MLVIAELKDNAQRLERFLDPFDLPRQIAGVVSVIDHLVGDLADRAGRFGKQLIVGSAPQ